MPFGLCNAAAAFQRLMQTALIALYPKHCMIYLDDILVFDKDILEHNANLKLVPDHLQDVGSTLNPKKCHLLQRTQRSLYGTKAKALLHSDSGLTKLREQRTPFCTRHGRQRRSRERCAIPTGQKRQRTQHHLTQFQTQ
ncbi:hypothetical protein TSMEX_002287 [Taenia solium]|eukprot:TsM_000942200 transcript=TsM_000942200 gene=TsM_000942200